MFIIEVMHMAPLKQHMYQHLRSAKEWLTKAEEAFDKEHDVRAELDLMLAQAELQHAKEANRSQQWRYKYIVFRHGVALVLAMFMAVAVGGVYWWTHKPALLVPVPLAGQVHLPVEVVAKTETQVVPPKMPDEKSVPTQQVEKVAVNPSPSKVEEFRKPEQAPYQPESVVVVSADEKQKLVRAAGKSLRGQ
ncbi:hypothetical protein [Pelosinus sp. sgz500959]|uniref:hypothetical protein n=1 Tax=Pelosinus sp. sgz500959 TaxID=3242472 RepID=UPI00367151D8